MTSTISNCGYYCHFGYYYYCCCHYLTLPTWTKNKPEKAKEKKKNLNGHLQKKRLYL